MFNSYEEILFLHSLLSTNTNSYLAWFLKIKINIFIIINNDHIKIRKFIKECIAILEVVHY